MSNSTVGTSGSGSVGTPIDPLAALRATMKHEVDKINEKMDCGGLQSTDELEAERKQREEERKKPTKGSGIGGPKNSSTILMILTVVGAILLLHATIGVEATNFRSLHGQLGGPAKAAVLQPVRLQPAPAKATPAKVTPPAKPKATPATSAPSKVSPAKTTPSGTPSRSSSSSARKSWASILSCVLTSPPKWVAPSTGTCDVSTGRSLPAGMATALENAVKAKVDPTASHTAADEVAPLSATLISKLTTKLKGLDTTAASRALDANAATLAPTVVAAAAAAAGMSRSGSPTASAATTAAPSSRVRALVETETGSESTAGVDMGHGHRNPYIPSDVWPNKQVNYVFSARVNNPSGAAETAKAALTITSFLEAMREWSSRTCVTFVEVTPGQPLPAEYVTLDWSDWSSSTSARGKKANDCHIRIITDALGGYTIKPDAVHELGHVLGMDHPMTRSDASKYVKYNLDPMGRCIQGHCAADSARMAAARTGDFVKALLPGFKVKGAVKAFLAAPVEPGFERINAELTRMNANNRIMAFVGMYSDAVLTEALAFAACSIGIAGQFTYKSVPGDTLATTYDYASVMHYKFDLCMSVADGKSTNGVTPGTALLPSPLDVLTVCQNFQCGIKVTVRGTAAPLAGGTPIAWTTERYVFPVDVALSEVRRQILAWVTDDPNEVFKAYDATSLAASVARPMQETGGAALLDTTVLSASANGRTAIDITFT